MKTKVIILSGLIWGILGAWLSAGGVPSFRWFAVPGGILIGALIYRTSRWTYRASPWALLPTAAVTTVIAVALFGLAVGLVDLARGIPGRIPLAVVLQTVLGFLWGLLYSPLLWWLFLLALANHALLRRIELTGGLRRAS